eukprot:COSAG02_NODE_633_length_19262_cov_32.473256_7_plen_306_part_00
MGEGVREGARGRDRDGSRLFYGSLSPLTPTDNHDRTNVSGGRSDLKSSTSDGKSIRRGVEDRRQADGVDSVSAGIDRSDSGQPQKDLLGRSEGSPGIGSGSRRRGEDSLSGGSSSGIAERRRVCSIFDPVRKVSTIDQLASSVDHAREHEHLVVVLLANPSCELPPPTTHTSRISFVSQQLPYMNNDASVLFWCPLPKGPKCRELVKQMSLVVVATTEQTPFSDGGNFDTRRQPRGSGVEDIDEEGATGHGGRQQLQPHESQLATFAHIPSSGSGGHCAHYICPITVTFARCLQTPIELRSACHS